jgi:hypothetical protein
MTAVLRQAAASTLRSHTEMSLRCLLAVGWVLLLLACQPSSAGCPASPEVRGHNSPANDAGGATMTNFLVLVGAGGGALHAVVLACVRVHSLPGSILNASVSA